MKKPNPKHAQPQPLAGQQLPDDWRNSTADHGGIYDRRDLSQLWKTPQWSSKLNSDNVNNLMRNARLSSTVASGI